KFYAGRREINLNPVDESAALLCSLQSLTAIHDPAKDLSRGLRLPAIPKAVARRDACAEHHEGEQHPNGSPGSGSNLPPWSFSVHRTAPISIVSSPESHRCYPPSYA